MCCGFLELASTRTVFVATARRVDTFWELESESASELQQSRIPTVQACGNGVPGSGSGTEPVPGLSFVRPAQRGALAVTLRRAGDNDLWQRDTRQRTQKVGK